DGAVALDRLDRCADRGQRAPEVDVGLVLVAEAAFEAPAHAREFRGIQRERLLLRHLDGDGLKLLQPRRAAELAPARTDAAGHLALVARADLLHVDACVEYLRELPSELAQVDALLTGDEERHLAAVERSLGLHQLEGQVSRAHEL